MNVYEKLNMNDWISPFESQMDSMEMRFDSDGKFKVFRRLIKNQPWLENKKSYDMQARCHVYSEYFAKGLGFIHSHCHDCWKVVVKPNKVTELFDLFDMQKESEYPAKCGIEFRKYVPRLYGGYYYNRSRQNGLDCHSAVKRLVLRNISPDIEVILKRGCTEMEMSFGASDKWAIIEGQKKREEEFEEIYVEDVKMPEYYPSYVISFIKKKWIEFAANQKIPDMSYLELTGGNPLARHVNYVTYHDKEPLIKVVGG